MPRTLGKQRHLLLCERHERRVWWGAIGNLIRVELATCVSAKREQLKEVGSSHTGLANQSAGFDLTPESASERFNGDRSEGCPDSLLSWIAE